MQQNRSAAMARILASEGGERIDPAEPGGVSDHGISLEAFREYRTAHGLWAAPTRADLEAMADADIQAFYAWKVLTPVRFDDLPSGVDYALADFAVNSGVAGALNACRFLFRVQGPIAYWRMDDPLLKALCALPPALVVNAICDIRWAMMQACDDFLTPSSVPGKILGDGRAFRMSEVHRGAMELIGLPAEAPKYAVPALVPPAQS